MCFAHLHNHSGYSILDGYSTVREIVDTAKFLGHQSVALTDHGNMFGIYEFYKYAKKSGIKPIVGVEAYMMPFDKTANVKERIHGHLLLLAKNNTGYKNLCHLVTASQRNFYYHPRIDSDLLKRYKDGLVTTSGCMAAEIPSLIREGKLKDAEKVLIQYLEIFGENFYIELQDHDIPELTAQNEVLLDFSKKYGVECIVTNDTHYSLKSHASAHDVALCVQTGKKLSDSERMKFSSDNFYLKHESEMPFKEFHEATGRLAEECNVEISDKSFKIPKIGDISVLRKIAYEGAKNKYSVIPKDKIDYEISVIEKMGFESYILMVADIISFAKRNGILYSVRGSAAGSILCYVLDITKIEPISNGLFFERFLNPDRVSMPDIDMDFASDQRGEIIDYVVEKYGKDKVAQIVTFGTMGAKAALKDAARVLGVPIKEVERLSNLVPTGAKATDLKGCESITEYKLLLEDDILKNLHEIAKQLEGRVRNSGIHAAGVVISSVDIENVIPLVRVEKSSLSEKIDFASQYEMGHLEELGLIKMDFLGLSTLTVLRKAMSEINRKYGQNFNYDNIPTSSPETWAMLKQGDTTGVFQLGGDGMTDVITKMSPQSFENITAAVALFRPGPLQYIPSYIARMHGKEDVVYPHESLEEILKETYGVCVHEDTLIITENGNKKIKDLKVGERVLSYNENTGENEFKKITRVYDNSIKKCIKVKTKRDEVICTPDHKFFTQEGWVKAKELKNTNLVATWVGINGCNKTLIGNNKARILGLLLSEGSTTKGSCIFYNKNFSLCEDFMSLVSKEFDDIDFTVRENSRGVYRITVKDSKKHNKFQQRPSSLVSWLRKIGLYGSVDKNKSLKTLVYNLSNEEKKYLLSGLFDGDGTVSSPRVWGFVSASHALSENVFYLLRSCGINCYMYMYPSYTRVYISDRQSYYEKISKISHIKPKGDFVGNEIKIDANLALKCLSEMPDIVDDYCSEIIGIDAQLRRRLKNGECKFIKFKDENKPFSNLIKEKLPLNYKTFSEIEIEEFGEAHVYDIEVEDNHNYYGNNILLHNCVYQEQVMKMSIEFSGYTFSEADTLRKAIGKKDKDLLLAQEEKFVGGAVKNGHDENVAKKLWEDILPSARYSFNKAHAAVYADMACKTAWLKAHYPQEFIAAFLDEELNNGRVDSVSPLKSRYKILPPSLKNVDTIADEGGIRIGMTAIKGISLDCARNAFLASDSKTVGEFVKRVNPNKTQLEAFVKAGVLDHLYGRAALWDSIPNILKWKTAKNKKTSMFDLLIEDKDDAPLERRPSTIWDDKDYMDIEMETFGFYIEMSPEEKVHLKFKSTDIKELKKGKLALIAGTYTMRVIDTKKGDKMAFLSLVNKDGKIDVTVFPKQYTKYKELLEKNAPIQIYGKGDEYNGKVSLIADLISDEDLSGNFPTLFEKVESAGEVFIFLYDEEEESDVARKIRFMSSFYAKDGFKIGVFNFPNFETRPTENVTCVNPIDLITFLKEFN